MNKKLKAIAAAVMAMTTLLLSGCASSGFDNTNLLRPPRTTGDKAQIQEIIEEKAGGDYTLKYPKNGNYRSAIINEDLDNDEIDEAIVFYKPSKDDESAHILLIKNFGGTWKDIGDYSSGKTDVDRIEIGDITGNGTNDIIVGWTDQSGSICSLSAYIVDKKTTAELKVEDTYNQFIAADITAEGRNSIILLSLASQSSGASAKMLQFDTETKTIFTRSSVAMSNSASGYLNIQYGKASKEQAGIFVDTYGINKKSETQFIYWDKTNSELANPLNTENSDKVSTNPTQRNSADAICIDLDGDGLIEVPTRELMPHNSTENIELVVFQTTWNRYDPKSGELSPLLETVTDSSNGYYFIIPDEWSGKVTARANTSNNSLSFYLWNPAAEADYQSVEEAESLDATLAEGALGDKLLTIQIFSAQDWTDSKNKDYIEIGDYGDIVYTVNIPAETKNTKGIAMSLNKIPDYFKLINK